MTDWTPNMDLLRRYDDAEWLKVERTYCGRMMAYVSRRISDRDAREDIVQETFLGAVRGIDLYDSAYTFEQFLFGICKNRTIDHMRRTKMPTLGGTGLEGDDRPTIEDLARDDETPSRIVRQKDLEEAGVRMLQDLFRTWVEETWKQEEFVRLMVVEALFAGNWRNRDTWQRFDLRDETSVAGIKFRALKRLRELALERDTQRKVAPLLTAAVDSGEGLAIDVSDTWREGRVSCPARHWVARLVARTLAPGPTAYLRFHLDEMRCDFCRANYDDLVELEKSADLEPLLSKVGASTLQYLRSRTSPKA